MALFPQNTWFSQIQSTGARVTFLVFILARSYLRNPLSQRHIQTPVPLPEPENLEELRRELVLNEEKTGWSQNRAQRTLAENGPGVTTGPCAYHHYNIGLRV